MLCLLLRMLGNGHLHQGGQAGHQECPCEAQFGRDGQTRTRIFLCCNNPISRTLQRNTCDGGQWHVTQATDVVAVLVRATDCKESKCSSMEDQFNEWQIHAVENEVAVKNEKALRVLP